MHRSWVTYPSLTNISDAKVWSLSRMGTIKENKLNFVICCNIVNIQTSESDAIGYQMFGNKPPP